MQFPKSHRRPWLVQLGRDVMFAGAAVFFLPLLLPKADGLANAHELWRLAGHHLWWQFAGVSVFTLGNMLRLVGVQGHVGLPWPPIGRHLPHDLVAGIQIRRRASQNRTAARAEAVAAAATRRHWRFRLTARRLHRPRIDVAEGRRLSPSTA